MYPEFCRSAILLRHACRVTPCEIDFPDHGPGAGRVDRGPLDRYRFRRTSSAAPLFAAARRPPPASGDLARLRSHLRLRVPWRVPGPGSPRFPRRPCVTRSRDCPLVGFGHKLKSEGGRGGSTTAATVENGARGGCGMGSPPPYGGDRRFLRGPVRAAARPAPAPRQFCSARFPVVCSRDSPPPVRGSGPATEHRCPAVAPRADRIRKRCGSDRGAVSKPVTTAVPPRIPPPRVLPAVARTAGDHSPAGCSWCVGRPLDGGA